METRRLDQERYVLGPVLAIRVERDHGFGAVALDDALACLHNLEKAGVLAPHFRKNLADHPVVGEESIGSFDGRGHERTAVRYSTSRG